MKGNISKTDLSAQISGRLQFVSLKNVIKNVYSCIHIYIGTHKHIINMHLLCFLFWYTHWHFFWFCSIDSNWFFSHFHFHYCFSEKEAGRWQMWKHSVNELHNLQINCSFFRNSKWIIYKDVQESSYFHNLYVL